MTPSENIIYKLATYINNPNYIVTVRLHGHDYLVKDIAYSPVPTPTCTITASETSWEIDLDIKELTITNQELYITATNPADNARFTLFTKTDI